jgi:hypothetical protein
LGKKKKLHKKRADGAAQGEGSEFKPQYHKKKKERKIIHSLAITNLFP